MNRAVCDCVEADTDFANVVIRADQVPVPALHREDLLRQSGPIGLEQKLLAEGPNGVQR